MRTNAASFEALRAYVEDLPIIDCHDHTGECGPKYEDPLQVIVNGYFPSDLQSASCDADIERMQDRKIPWEERWPVFERAWKRTCHTGYAQVTRRVLAKFYDEEEVTLEAARRMQDKLLDLTDCDTYENILEEAKIVARLEDVWPPLAKVMDGSYELSPRGRMIISLPALHAIRSRQSVGETQLEKALGITITSLDEYLDACRRAFQVLKDAGAVAFKDQSAYTRQIAYGNPSRAEAEAVFNWFMEDPRRSAAYPDQTRPMDDYLMHAFMRMARDLDLPVQIHTGHMAGIRNEIGKTNAVHLTRLIELHREVQFDLFHANWPYDGELIYLAKNYPNVAIDFCWANIIDPIYCQRMFVQALSSVPHCKIHGYGSDHVGMAEMAWAHASLARDNIAIALSEMVDMDYLGLEDAKEVAYAWLFGNANEFFRLGL